MSQPSQNEQDTFEIRRLLTEAFGDEGFTFFCYDHFRDVHRQFSAGMTRPAKIQLLIDHCDGHNLFDRLLSLVRKANPAKCAELGFLPPQTGQPGRVQDRATGISINTGGGDVAMDNAVIIKQSGGTLISRATIQGDIHIQNEQAAWPDQPGSKPAVTPAQSGATLSLHQAKIEALQNRRADLLADYQAANAQLGTALGEVDRARIKRQIEQLEQEIAQVEGEIRLLQS